jgi:HSP20 family molecular chaperone IbpA
MSSRPNEPVGTRGVRDPEAGRGVNPRIDIYETDTSFVIVADMPGVRPDGLDVVAQRDVLSLRGRVTRPERPPDHQEYELIDYFQTLTLTEDLDASGVSASLKDGVLRVTIPKSPTIQPKKIQVRVE